INIYLSPQWLTGRVNEIATDPRLGITPTDQPQTVVVDYPGLNVAKESHIGHLRPSVIGDAIARILAFNGDRVIRQNHIGDWGTAFGMLLAYMAETGGKSDASLADIETLYRAAKQRFDQDDAFKTAARQAVVRLQAGEPDELRRWQAVIEISRKHLDEIFSLMGLLITRDDERGESFYNDRLADIVDELQKLSIAELSEGAMVVWVKPFSTPLIIRKSDGGYGYGTTDLAAARFRTRELKADRLIYLTDSRQRQHFLQFSDAARRAGWLDGVGFDHVMFGALLGPDGKPFKTKEGESVKLKDVLYEAIERARRIVEEKNQTVPAEARSDIARAVGIGSLKYFDLAHDRLSDYVFDWNTMLAMEGNTAPYLQYAHARIRSIFRKADNASSEAAITLDAPQELSLAKHILRLGETLDTVARDLKPHVLCAYLYELATRFSAFYEHCPVLKSEEPMRSSRLALCALTARTMALGLDLLGIEHPEQM
ncbi:MAG TPA: arginine--tRNA ligase, partial [Tepidisphaeraceae bacterium]